MSNVYGIDKYKKEVLLIEAVLAEVNVTQAERVKRVYENAFEKHLLSDQDFFEAINWYAKKVINVASRNSLTASRKFDVVKIRYWNSVIIVLTPLLGDHPWFEMSHLIDYVQDSLAR